MYTLTCKLCGQSFESTMPHGNVCYSCKNRPCEVCGKPFLHDWPYDQHCCSSECRKIWINDPEHKKRAVAKRDATVKERYGVDNISMLQSTRDKLKEARMRQLEESRPAREAKQKAELEAKQKRQEEAKRRKEEEKIEKEKAEIRSRLTPCKYCGKLFVKRGSYCYCEREHHATCKVCGADYIVKRVDLPYPRNVCYNPKCASEWRKIRSIELYGVPNSGGLPQFLEKGKQTNLQKYGVDNPFKSEEIKEQIKQTNIQKYGVPYATQSEEVKLKQAQTLLANWGKGMPELVKKRRETCLKRYGVSNPRKLPEVEAKIEATNVEKYGTPFPRTELLKGNLCQRKARLSTISKVNLAFVDLLNEVGWDAQVEFNIETKWYDIWEEDHPILIEIDPSFTHFTYDKQVVNNMVPLPFDYQLAKTELANKYGYHCVHIFDWDDRYQIIQMLRKDKKKLYARKCKVVEIDVQTARNFESVYHLQGAVKNQEVCLGLDFEGDLVEVMTFGPPRYNHNYQWELLRLCTQFDYSVIGGASKLFKYFLRNYSPESVISYCDRAKFSGDVYKNIGMTLHHTSSPAKIWSKGTRKITDNLLRQRGYDQLFGTNYGKGTSNEELMFKNGWLPVYDCGQLVFEWRNI